MPNEVFAAKQSIWRKLNQKQSLQCEPNRQFHLGIGNFSKLRACSLSFLSKHFGPFWSWHLYNIARGIDQSPVIPMETIADAKSVSRTYTTHRNLSKKTEIEKLMRNLCEEAAAKARRMGLCGRYVGFCIRGGEESYWDHQTLKTYTSDGKILFDLCLQISKDWSFQTVRFCGITLAMLTKDKYKTVPLFSIEQRRRDLVSTIDRINQRFGDYTIFPGQLLGTAIVRPEVNGYFGDKKFRLNFLRND